MQSLHDSEKEETVTEMSDVVHSEHLDRAAEFQELKREMQEIKDLLREKGS